MWSNAKVSLRLAIFLTVVFFAILQISTAQVMTSSNYSLQSDSINVGGGLSSSTNYIQESTVGEIATGDSDSASYNLRAGYQQLGAVSISLSAALDVTMTPPIGGLTGGTSNGSTTVTVITDSPSGYQLTIEAENSPAMQYDVYSIADYVPVGVPDFIFDTTTTDAHFGFSPTGVDTADAFLDDGGDCSAGLLNTDLACWDGLSVTPTLISQSGGSNQPLGATTTINFRVGIGSSAGVIAGVYTATTTLTALPL